MAEQIHTTVWEGSFTVFGVTLRCYVLENGQRIINAEDLESLFEATALNPDEGGLAGLLAWSAGGKS